MSTLTRDQLAGLREFVAMPEDIAAMASAARADLYGGPDATTYENLAVASFSAAVDAVREWTLTLPSTLWLDTDTDGWGQPIPCDEDDLFYTVVYERSDWVRLLFGRELAEHL